MKGIVVLRNRKWNQLIDDEWVPSKPPYRLKVKQMGDKILVWLGPWLIFIQATGDRND